jgi:hypothetical protein
MGARIYQPSKTATQSGAAKSRRWLLEFEPETAREIEPLMGWTSSADMNAQVKLWFETKEDALAYAARKGIAASVEEPAQKVRRTQAYSDNFKTSRVGQWTH